MSDNELLLAISAMMDTKLAPIEDVALLKKVVAEHSEKLQAIS